MPIPYNEQCKGKRLAAFDYGERRIGFAVCDELHISVSPRGIFENRAGVIDKIIPALQAERIGAVIVGMPYRRDGGTSPLIEQIEGFIATLRARLNIPVFETDEAYSTRHAFAAMVQANVKKKNRRKTGKKDEVAAAVILRSFLEEQS